MWVFLLLAASSASAFLNPYPKGTTRVSKIEDTPLLLTPYIESGNIDEARKLSLVTDLSPNITQYTGYITTNEECGDNLFFWFFPSQNDWLKDPVTVWLDGGPGAPSFLSLFGQMGPYSLTMDGELLLNPYSWNRNSSMIFIDNPVGTGWSFTEKGCYVTNQEQVGQALLNMLTQFFQLFPELKENPFFLTGESYGGKYVPAVAHAIHNSNPKQINLKGVAIGNGLIDPINQLNYADYLYQIGLLDDHGSAEIHALELEIPGAIEAGNDSLATQLFFTLLNTFVNISGYGSYDNYLYTEQEPIPDVYSLLDQDDVRRAIHVGNATLNGLYGESYLYLLDDFMRSVRPWFEELLDNDYRVVLYNGQVDIIVAYPLTINFVKKLNWKGAEEYKTAERHVWYVGEDLAGYAKTVRNFTEILVRNAGHLVPMNQPKWSLDMYNRFIDSINLLKVNKHPIKSDKVKSFGLYLIENRMSNFVHMQYPSGKKLALPM